MGINQFPGIDPASVHDVVRSGRQVIDPDVERSFGDDSVDQFNEGTEVVLPTKARLTGETVVHARIRWQAEAGTK